MAITGDGAQDLSTDKLMITYLVNQLKGFSTLSSNTDIVNKAQDMSDILTQVQSYVDKINRNANLSLSNRKDIVSSVRVQKTAVNLTATTPTQADSVPTTDINSPAKIRGPLYSPYVDPVPAPRYSNVPPHPVFVIDPNKDLVRVDTSTDPGTGAPNVGVSATGKTLNKDTYYDKSNLPVQFVLPGYHSALLEVETPTDANRFYFLVSPSSFTETRSNIAQPNKTGGGYFIYRLGPGLTELNLSGYMLDAKSQVGVTERAAFTESFFKNLTADQVDSASTGSFRKYRNDNTTRIYLEGYVYVGHITNVVITKSSTTLFLYQYQLSMLVVEDTRVYDPAQALNANQTKQQKDPSLLKALSKTLAKTLRIPVSR